MEIKQICIKISVWTLTCWWGWVILKGWIKQVSDCDFLWCTMKWIKNFLISAISHQPQHPPSKNQTINKPQTNLLHLCKYMFFFHDRDCKSCHRNTMELLRKSTFVLWRKPLTLYSMQNSWKPSRWVIQNMVPEELILKKRQPEYRNVWLSTEIFVRSQSCLNFKQKINQKLTNWEHC